MCRVMRKCQKIEGIDWMEGTEVHKCAGSWGSVRRFTSWISWMIKNAPPFHFFPWLHQDQVSVTLQVLVELKHVLK
jgi:hypothetical protein